MLTSEGLGERAQVIPEGKRESVRLIQGGFFIQTHRL